MKCRICKVEIESQTLGELENHLWEEHESFYRPQWTRRIRKFILKEKTAP